MSKPKPKDFVTGYPLTDMARYGDACIAYGREQAQADAERLDWLEAFINKNGAVNMHDGDHPNGLGIGLRPGNLNRTLREAIDATKGTS